MQCLEIRSLQDHLYPTRSFFRSFLYHLGTWSALLLIPQYAFPSRTYTNNTPHLEVPTSNYIILHVSSCHVYSNWVAVRLKSQRQERSRAAPKMQIEYHVLVQDIRFFRHHPKTVKKLVCQNLLTLVHLTQKGYCDEKVSEQELWCWLISFSACPCGGFCCSCHWWLQDIANHLVKKKSM